MPAARYWRIVGIETYAGGDLELSELHLYGASGRVDAAATLTSTIAPTAGTLAALQDDNLGTACRFAGAAVRSGGFALVWDFGGSPADAIGVRLGAATAQAMFMAGCTLQYSTDCVQWSWSAAFARYEWPGVGAYTAADAAGTVFVPPTLHTAASAAQIAASATVPAHTTPLAPRLQLARDIEHGGPGTIHGTTKTKGSPDAPVKARVVLLAQRGKALVRETWSDPATGNFAFKGLDPAQKFLTLAEDASGDFRPIAASFLVPEVLP